MSDLVPAKKKIGLHQAAIEVTMVVNDIFNADTDDAEIIDRALQARFDDSLADVVSAVDRRKAFLRELESKITIARGLVSEAKDAIKSYQAIAERLTENTKQLVLKCPDVEFRDSLGKKLFVIDNPVPRIVVDEYEIDAYPHYYTKTVTQLDQSKIKAELLLGVELPWARLEYGQQLRGLK